MLIRPRHAALVAAAALLPLTPAGARNVTADIGPITTVLRSAGYKAQIEGEGAERYIATGTGGANFTIRAYGCNPLGGDCKNVMFSAWFESETPPTLEAMNEYARKMRWGRIYIDHEGDPTIEMDIDLEDGGVSEELFIDNVEYGTRRSTPSRISSRRAARRNSGRTSPAASSESFAR